MTGYYSSCGVFAALFLAPLLAVSAPADSSIVFFPREHLIQEFMADGTGHRLSIAKLFQANRLLARIGGTVPLVEGAFVGRKTQMGFGASVSTQLHPQQTIAVISTEFYVDYAIIDIEWNPILFSRLAFGHTSHHLGDGKLQKPPIDFSRDYIKALLVLDDGITRIYGGADYGYGYVVVRPVERKWILQAGCERILVEFGTGLFGFAAVDLKLRQDLKFGTTQSIQGGIQFSNGSDRLIRLTLMHRSGLEERGQFHGQRTTATSLGIVVEF